MGKEDKDDGGEQQEWTDWFEESASFWIMIAVFGASLVVPVALWIASKFFGWEPPEFIMEWIDFFAA